MRATTATGRMWHPLYFSMSVSSAPARSEKRLITMLSPVAKGGAEISAESGGACFGFTHPLAACQIVNFVEVMPGGICLLPCEKEKGYTPAAVRFLGLKVVVYA